MSSIVRVLVLCLLTGVLVAASLGCRGFAVGPNRGVAWGPRGAVTWQR
jgi:hypothetical protein